MDKELESMIWAASLAFDLMTGEEKAAMITEQRKNFVYGNVKFRHPNVTREMVEKMVDRIDKK